VQQKAARAPGESAAGVHGLAKEGTAGRSEALPFLDVIQKSFGRHDVSGIEAFVGGPAKKASQAMGAQAYATGNKVAFAQSPDLHTAAHEPAHIVQQRGGVSLKGGVGQAGDQYEQHADTVADKVVQGESAEELLDPVAGNGAISHSSVAVQHIGVKDVLKGFVGPAGGVVLDQLDTLLKSVDEYFRGLGEGMWEGVKDTFLGQYEMLDLLAQVLIEHVARNYDTVINFFKEMAQVFTKKTMKALGSYFYNGFFTGPWPKRARFAGKITGYIIVELIVGFLTAGVGTAVKWSTKLGPALQKIFKRFGKTGGAIEKIASEAAEAANKKIPGLHKFLKDKNGKGAGGSKDGSPDSRDLKTDSDKVDAGGALVHNSGAQNPKDALNHNKELASKQQVGELKNGQGKIMAGKGHKTAIRDEPRLINEHGGSAGDWQKVKSSSHKAPDGTLIETHAYQKGKKVVELKTKIDRKVE